MSSTEKKNVEHLYREYRLKNGRYYLWATYLFGTLEILLIFSPFLLIEKLSIPGYVGAAAYFGCLLVLFVLVWISERKLLKTLKNANALKARLGGAEARIVNPHVVLDEEGVVVTGRTVFEDEGFSYL